MLKNHPFLSVKNEQKYHQKTICVDKAKTFSIAKPLYFSLSFSELVLIIIRF